MFNVVSAHRIVRGRQRLDPHLDVPSTTVSSVVDAFVNRDKMEGMASNSWYLDLVSMEPSPELTHCIGSRPPVSPILSVSRLGEEDPSLGIHPLNGTISMSLPLQHGYENLESHNVEIQCVFFDAEQRRWSHDGCRTVQLPSDTSRSIVCECDHLTDFAVIMAQEQTDIDINSAG